MSLLDYYPPTGIWREINGTADDEGGDADYSDIPQSPDEYDQSYVPKYDNGGCHCCGHTETGPGDLCEVCGAQM